MFGQNARHTNRLQLAQADPQMAIQRSSAGGIVIHYNTGSGQWMIQSSPDLSNWQPYKTVTGSGSTTIPIKTTAEPGFFRLISVD